MQRARAQVARPDGDEARIKRFLERRRSLEVRRSVWIADLLFSFNVLFA